MIGFIPFSTREQIPRRTFPFVTITILLANLAVFAYQIKLLFDFGPGALENFFLQYGLIPAQFLAGGFLDPALITSMFMHAGLLHLAGNMLFLLAFGDNVEDRLGHLRYAIMYLLWGVAAALAHVFFNPGSLVPSVGASGAIGGVLGAYLILFPKGVVRSIFFVFIFFTVTRLPAALMILVWFGMQFYSGLASLGAETAQTGGVAVWAHIGGFLAGLLTALLLPKRALSRPEPVPHTSPTR